MDDRWLAIRNYPSPISLRAFWLAANAQASAHLDASSTSDSLSTEILPVMRSFCFRFVVVIVVPLFAASSLRSQEAVEQTTKPAEESTPEATPETTPDKSAKKDASSEKPAKSLEETMRPEEFKA